MTSFILLLATSMNFSFPIHTDRKDVTNCSELFSMTSKDSEVGLLHLLYSIRIGNIPFWLLNSTVLIPLRVLHGNFNSFPAVLWAGPKQFPCCPQVFGVDGGSPVRGCLTSTGGARHKGDIRDW